MTPPYERRVQVIFKEGLSPLQYEQLTYDDPIDYGVRDGLLYIRPKVHPGEPARSIAIPLTSIVYYTINAYPAVDHEALARLAGEGEEPS